MHLSVEASLKKLRTTYIDILYLHWWDWNTSVEEVMNGLHHLVAQGKVLYLVLLTPIICRRHSLIPVLPGCIRHASMGRLKSQSIRKAKRQDPFRHLPRGMERHGTLF